MRPKLLPLVVSLLLPLSAQTLGTHTYGGSGSDAANAVTTDTAGNIYVAGTTTSFDLPLLNPAQPVNSGTQLLYSVNAGFTWKPLGNLPDAYPPYQVSQTMTIAVDPTNPEIFYLASNGAIFKTTDGGQHFSSTRLLPAGYTDITILIDPSNPSTLYAAVPTPGGLFKSTDGGVTWSGAVLGLPSDSIGPIVLDPFHPQTLWLDVGGLGYVSTDGANTWSPAPLPASANGGVVQFVFDQVKPDMLYVIGRPNGNGTPYLLKSTDGGKNWFPVTAPFQQLGPLVADPVRAGRLYLLSEPNLFHRSIDGGVTWQSFPFPGGYASAVAVDPGNPNIILAGSYRSNNGGETWSPTMASRDIRMTFAPTGKDLVYASGPLTSDAFLAKFKPDGKTLEYATYFGGMGNETAQSVQLDASGNIWVAGTTNSFDLPGSQHGAATQLKGPTNIFVAKFSPRGELLASTYLGGAQTDSVAALRLDPSGDPWIFGKTDSPDFPFTKDKPPPAQPGTTYVFLVKMNASVSQLLYAAPIQGVSQTGGMSIDSAGNIVLTGTAYSSDFPVTPGVVHGTSAPGKSALLAFLIKLDNRGDTIFSTYFSGIVAADTSGIPLSSDTELETFSVAVTTDATGIYVTGNTSATDFPTTPGAYQTKLGGSGCSYPAFADDTGLIGTIYSYLVDDVFVTKISPDGKTMVYSTLLGGSCYDRPTDIAVTPSGSVFVTGETDSVDFPQVHPQHGAPAVQTYKSFISMLSPTGTALTYSSYLSAGSSPNLALGSGGILDIAGDIGFGAQTMTYSGFPNPPVNPLTKVALIALNVSPKPAALDLTSVVNAFSLLPGPVAAGEILEITVPDFKPEQTVNVGISDRLPLGTTLENTQVLFDGKPVPMMGISAGKIECIAPHDFGTNTSTSIQVNANGTISNALQEDVAPTALGLLSADGSGSGLANARNQDGTLNSAGNPAKPGSKVTVFFTGAGSPPTTIATPFGGAVTVAPLHGFVPGIYSATFEIPSNAGGPLSPLGITLYGPGASIVVPGSSSQTLIFYVK